MDTAVLKSFPVVKFGEYYAYLENCLCGNFLRGNVLCLKRGNDGKDCYLYSMFGVASKYVVNVSHIYGVTYFSFPKVLSDSLGITEKDKNLYVYYSDDGSVMMSKNPSSKYDFSEKVVFESNMFVSKSMDTRGTDSFYAVVFDTGDFVLVPIGTAMWSFIIVKSKKYYLLIENIYDFVVRRELGTESVVIRYYGECPRMFEVLNNVGH